MTETFTLFTALLAGLFGSLHCVGMCGGISSALSLATDQQGSAWKKNLIVVTYNAGRISTYAFAGLLAGTIGTLMDQIVPEDIAGIGFRAVTGMMMILIGAFLAFNLQWIEKITAWGLGFWRQISPFAGKLMPVKTLPSAYLLGLIWGWLPCGLVYAVLMTAWFSGDALQGTSIMLVFGLGTLPSMLTTGLAANWIQTKVQKQQLRLIAGISMILFGLWTLIGPSLIHKFDLPIPEGMAGCM